jgi:hypothetical protein
VRVIEIQVYKEGDLWKVRHGVGQYEFRTRELAVTAAKKVARQVESGGVQVKILVQDGTGEWRPEEGL